MIRAPQRQILMASALALGLQGCAHLPHGGAPEFEGRPIKMASAEVSIADGLYNDAVAAIERRDYAGALELLQAARERTGDDARLLNAFGVVYDKLGRFDLSERYYLRAQALDPKSPIVAQNLAYSQTLQGHSTALSSATSDLAAADSASDAASSSPPPAPVAPAPTAPAATPPAPPAAPDHRPWGDGGDLTVAAREAARPTPSVSRPAAPLVPMATVSAVAAPRQTRGPAIARAPVLAAAPARAETPVFVQEPGIVPMATVFALAAPAPTRGPAIARARLLGDEPARVEAPVFVQEPRVVQARALVYQPSIAETPVLVPVSVLVHAPALAEAAALVSAAAIASAPDPAFALSPAPQGVAPRAVAVTTPKVAPVAPARPPLRIVAINHLRAGFHALLRVARRLPPLDWAAHRAAGVHVALAWRQGASAPTAPADRSASVGSIVRVALPSPVGGRSSTAGFPWEE
jgi:hypothetical protein